jgi:hypothetical protein
MGKPLSRFAYFFTPILLRPVRLLFVYKPHFSINSERWREASSINEQVMVLGSPWANGDLIY